MPARATSHLYLLVFPQHQVFKIGKADDVHARHGALVGDWGSADLAASWSLEIAREHVGNLERGLHRILATFRRHFAAGDGRTEMFRMEGMPAALHHLTVFSSHHGEALTMRKGLVAAQSMTHRLPPTPATAASRSGSASRKLARLRKIAAIVDAARDAGRMALEVDQLRNGQVQVRALAGNAASTVTRRRIACISNLMSLRCETATASILRAYCTSEGVDEQGSACWSVTLPDEINGDALDALVLREAADLVDILDRWSSDLRMNTRRDGKNQR